MLLTVAVNACIKFVSAHSYFQTVPDDGCDPELLKLETDRCLFADDGFKTFALKYKDSQDAFFEDYKIVSNNHDWYFCFSC